MAVLLGRVCRPKSLLRVSQSSTISELLRLQDEAHALQVEHQRLNYQQMLLFSILSVLGWRRRTLHSVEDCNIVHVNEWLDQLTIADPFASTAEQQLLEEWFTQWGPLHMPDMQFLGQGTASHMEATVAPAHDPTWLLRALYNAPIHPAADVITQQEYAKFYAAAIAELGLQLQQADRHRALDMATAECSALEAMQQQLISVLQLQTSLWIKERSSLILET
jgi:hypothetical protein